MDTFQALAEPRRREIIELLAQKGRLSASDISDNFRISPPAISQHLKILRESKLVDMEKHAQQRIYAINPTKLSEIENWIRELKKIWNGRLERLDVILREENLKRREVKTHGRQ